MHFEIISLPEPTAAQNGKKGEEPVLRGRGEWPTLREVEDRYIREVLEHCGGKLTGTDSATSLLDIHYTTLRSRMFQMGLLENDEDSVSGRNTESSSKSRKRRGDVVNRNAVNQSDLSSS